MAAPTYGAAGARLPGYHGDARIPIPTGVEANSVIVVFLLRAESTPYSAVTLPPDFALAPDSPTTATTGGGDLIMDVAWKRATTAETAYDAETNTGTYDFSWADINAYRTGFAVRIDGCRTTGDPFEADDGDYGTAATIDTPPVSVTTLGDDRLLLWAGMASSDGDTWTPPTGFTLQVDDVDFDLAVCATKTQAAAGASGSLVASQAGAPYPWAHTAWVGAFVGATSGHYCAPVGGAGDTTSGALGNEVLHLTPWRVDGATSVARLAVNVTGGGEAGCTARPGIYADTGSHQPGALIVDGGALAADTIDTPEATVAVDLEDGALVWIGAAVQDAPITEPTITVVDGDTAVAITSATLADVAGTGLVGYTQSGVSGALPDPFVSDGVSEATPRIIVRTP